MNKYTNIELAGKHEYDKEAAIHITNNKHVLTFSVGIFRWELTKSGKSVKKGKSIVRVSGLVSKKEKVFEKADRLVKELDVNGKWDGHKTIFVD